MELAQRETGDLKLPGQRRDVSIAPNLKARDKTELDASREMKNGQLDHGPPSAAA